MPSDLHQRASLPSELLSLDLLRPFGLEKAEWFRTDSGTSYRLSKSKSSLSSRKARPQPKENTTGVRICQQEIVDFHRLPQLAALGSAKAFVGNELRGSRIMILANQCWTYCGFEISLASFARRKKQIGVRPEFVAWRCCERAEGTRKLQNRTGRIACATRGDAGHHDDYQDDL